MRELSLFTGTGGGLLGTMPMGWHCVGAVEWEQYPCRVLEQRQKDGVLDDFPIWNMDIREFNRRIAPSYTGLVGVVSAGFPCQPFSESGKKLGADDPRNQWPATIECIRVVRPRYCLLENVPGLLSSGYFGTILGDLAESGYDTRWRVLSAAEVGAPHKRKRVWILATDTDMERRPRLLLDQPAFGTETSKSLPWGCALDSASNIMHRFEESVGQPAILGMDDGLPHRVDRLKAIGNGQVPAVVVAVWQMLSS